jgi:glycine cleavage system H protein
MSKPRSRTLSKAAAAEFRLADDFLRLVFDGGVSEANDTLVADPKLASSDPYGAGWLVKVRPKDWTAAKTGLVPGTAVADPYEPKMAADNFAGCP